MQHATGIAICQCRTARFPRPFPLKAIVAAVCRTIGVTAKIAAMSGLKRHISPTSATKRALVINEFRAQNALIGIDHSHCTLHKRHLTLPCLFQ
jgi:hypothetical protein